MKAMTFEVDNITMRQTIDVVNGSLAQATTCPEDGGMTYLVFVK